MVIQQLSDLKRASQRAIIINVGTRLVSTLALLSTIRYARMPILVLDCESQDGSVDHFTRLMSRYEFELISAPLRPHGLTLDWLFENIAGDQLLLVDSDLELKDSRIIEFFNEFIDEPTVFGCGFTNGPGWLSDKAFAKSPSIETTCSPRLTRSRMRAT